MAGLSVTVAIFMNFAPPLHGYVGEACFQTLRQIFVRIYHQLWFANRLKARFDSKIELIVSIGGQMFLTQRALIFQPPLRTLIRAGALYNFQWHLEFLCQLLQ